MEVKIEGKLGSGELILRQGFGNEVMELTHRQGGTEMTFYVGAEEFARVVQFLSEVNRARVRQNLEAQLKEYRDSERLNE